MGCLFVGTSHPFKTSKEKKGRILILDIQCRCSLVSARRPRTWNFLAQLCTRSQEEPQKRDQVKENCGHGQRKRKRLTPEHDHS